MIPSSLFRVCLLAFSAFHKYPSMSLVLCPSFSPPSIPLSTIYRLIIIITTPSPLLHCLLSQLPFVITIHSITFSFSFSSSFSSSSCFLASLSFVHFFHSFLHLSSSTFPPSFPSCVIQIPSRTDPIPAPTIPPSNNKYTQVDYVFTFPIRVETIAHSHGGHVPGNHLYNLSNTSKRGTWIPSWKRLLYQPYPIHGLEPRRHCRNPLQYVSQPCPFFRILFSFILALLPISCYFFSIQTWH